MTRPKQLQINLTGTDWAASRRKHPDGQTCLLAVAAARQHGGQWHVYRNYVKHTARNGKVTWYQHTAQSIKVCHAYTARQSPNLWARMFLLPELFAAKPKKAVLVECDPPPEKNASHPVLRAAGQAIARSVAKSVDRAVAAATGTALSMPSLAEIRAMPPGERAALLAATRTFQVPSEDPAPWPTPKTVSPAETGTAAEPAVI